MTHTHTHSQAIGLAMVAYGAASIAYLQDFGFFTQNSFIAGASIFVGIGVLKIILAIFGAITALLKNRWLMGIVSMLCGIEHLGFENKFEFVV